MAKNLTDDILTELSTKDSHWIVDFVEIIMSDDQELDTTLRLTTHYTELEIDSNIYYPAGQLMSMSSVRDNIEATDDNVTISLSGIDSLVTSAVLNSKVPGSEVKIYRGFFNEDSGRMFDTPYLVWSGLASAYSIQDSYNSDDEDKVDIQLECKSLLSSIMDRQSGLYTSLPSFQNVYETDFSMEFVAGLADRNFNFGKEK